MKGLARKITIYTMVGIMQFGISVSSLEASSRDNDTLPMHQKYDQDRDEHDRVEHGQHDRERMEQEKH